MRQRIGEILLLALGGGLALLSAEVGVRLFLGEQVKFPLHHVGASGVRINEPHARYMHRSADVEVELRINGQGMRASREYALARSDDVARVVVLGDSFAFGLEVEEEETFASVLERELRAGGLLVEVLNAGVSGFGNAEACLYLERELLRYEPDLVVLSFFGNDLVDNVRSDLLRLEGDRLVAAAPSYVPGTWERWFYETAPLNLLLERSDALALARERVGRLVLRRWLDAQLEDIASAEGGPAPPDGDVRQRLRLAAAILERIYSVLHERRIPLVILSIPTELREPLRLVDQFPAEDFDVRREGIWFLSAKAVLDPWLDDELLYWEQSQRHWTPFSHRVTGEALARFVATKVALDAAPGARGGPRTAQARSLPQDVGSPSEARFR